MGAKSMWGAKFGSRLKLLMNVKGVKRPEFARMADITQSSLCKYLQGSQIPRADVLPRMRKSLDCSYSDLLDF